MTIDAPEVKRKSKKVKNMKNQFGLPPGRKLAAVHNKKVERQLRKKGTVFYFLQGYDLLIL